jgi:hypothetical protein
MFPGKKAALSIGRKSESLLPAAQDRDDFY